MYQPAGPIVQGTCRFRHYDISGGILRQGLGGQQELRTIVSATEAHRLNGYREEWRRRIQEHREEYRATTEYS